MNDRLEPALVANRDPAQSGRGGYAPGAIRLQCRIGFWEMVGHLLLWVVLTVVTLGIGAFFFAYSLQKMVINHTVVVNRRGEPIGQLRCDYDVISAIGHVILWILITIITFGLAFFFYVYRVNKVVMSETELILD